jgi:galactosylceramidase
MKADAELAKAVAVVGLHYPSDFFNLGVCDSLGKPVWASEESSSYDDLNGAACWARVVQSHYVLSGITASIMWNLVGAYYPGTSWFASSMLTAVQPWSGHYSEKMAPVWATAHVTQFSKVGWKYLTVGSGSGLLRHGGYFTTIVDPNSTAFSVHVVKNSFDHAACTRPKLPPSLKDVAPETVTFKLSDPGTLGGSVTKLACWRSNFELEDAILFEQQADVEVTASGTFTLNVAIGDYFTISTERTASHGSFPDDVPSSEPQFPLPYHNEFDDEPTSQQPRFFSQMIGAFGE